MKSCLIIQSNVQIYAYFGVLCKCIEGGKDIETKRNNILIIGVFSVSKRNEPAYSRTLKDRSEANIFLSILCRIEVNTNWVVPNRSRIPQKRAGLVQNFPGSKENEQG